VGGKARRFLEIGQGPVDKSPGPAVRRDGVDEDHVQAVIARHDGSEVLGNVLGVEDADARPGDRPPDGAGDPGPDPVIVAERVADADEAGWLPQEIDEPGLRARIDQEFLRGLYTINGRRLYRESPA